MVEERWQRSKWDAEIIHIQSEDDIGSRQMIKYGRAAAKLNDS